MWMRFRRRGTNWPNGVHKSHVGGRKVCKYIGREYRWSYRVVKYITLYSAIIIVVHPLRLRWDCVWCARTTRQRWPCTMWHVGWHVQSVASVSHGRARARALNCARNDWCHDILTTERCCDRPGGSRLLRPNVPRHPAMTRARTERRSPPEMIILESDNGNRLYYNCSYCCCPIIVCYTIVAMPKRRRLW